MMKCIADVKCGGQFREPVAKDRWIVTNRHPSDARTTCCRLRDGHLHDWSNGAKVIDLSDASTKELADDIKAIADSITSNVYQAISSREFFADSEAVEIAESVRALVRKEMGKPFDL